MGYPARLLSQGERIDLQLRPHWKALVLPTLVLVLSVGAGGFLVAIAPSGSMQHPIQIAVGVVALLLILWFSFRPWVIWMNRNYIITNYRLIIREGFIHRIGRDIPLQKINDVSFKHTSLLDRMLGCGTLVCESAGEHGQVLLDDIPRVEETQRELSSLISGAEPMIEHKPEREAQKD